MTDSKTAKKIEVVPHPGDELPYKRFHVIVDGIAIANEHGGFWCGTEAEAQAKAKQLRLDAAIDETIAEHAAAQATETRPPQCGQPERDKQILAALDDTTIVYYGPHPCDLCGMGLIAKTGNGYEPTMRFDYPTEGFVYPNHNWIVHRCPPKPVCACTNGDSSHCFIHRPRKQENCFACGRPKSGTGYGCVDHEPEGPARAAAPVEPPPSDCTHENKRYVESVPWCIDCGKTLAATAPVEQAPRPQPNETEKAFAGFLNQRDTRTDMDREMDGIVSGIVKEVRVSGLPAARPQTVETYDCDCDDLLCRDNRYCTSAAARVEQPTCKICNLDEHGCRNLGNHRFKVVMNSASLCPTCFSNDTGIRHRINPDSFCENLWHAPAAPVVAQQGQAAEWDYLEDIERVISTCEQTNELDLAVTLDRVQQIINSAKAEYAALAASRSEEAGSAERIEKLEIALKKISLASFEDYARNIANVALAGNDTDVAKGKL